MKEFLKCSNLVSIFKVRWLYGTSKNLCKSTGNYFVPGGIFWTKPNAMFARPEHNEPTLEKSINVSGFF